MTDTELILKAYEILKGLTPLKSDCGRLCNAACCKGDEDTGMLLFPGESELFDGLGDFVIKKQGELDVVICNGHCKREQRPLSCRIFPLAIVYDGSRVKVIADHRSIPICPLYRQALSDRLDPAFRRAVKEVALMLGKSESIKGFLAEINSQCEQAKEIYTNLVK